jgi:hypothetical protein
MQKGCTIEDVSLRLGPWKDSGPRNWVPRPTERRARRKSGGSGGAPGRGTARGRVHAHLGLIGSRGWGWEALYGGAWRWPAGTAAAGRGSGEEGAQGGPHATLGHARGLWTAPNDLVARDGLD